MCNENKHETELELKTLLNEWKLPQLLHHFVAQNITVDILKMMKFHHINYALNGFTIGERIRFEYELEKWRRKLGSPLEYKEISIASESIISQIEKQVQEEPAPKTKIPTSTSTTQPPAKLLTLKNAVVNPTPTAPKTRSSTLPIQPQTQPQSTITNKNAIVSPTSIEALKISPTLQTRSQPEATASSKNTAIPAFRPPKELIALPKTPDVRSILMHSRPRGPELLKIYKERQSFAVAERSELINLLANFFYSNSIHLSLKMSHALEREILKVFPNEKLRDYRNEKRGRIYIRLCNIKNLKKRGKKPKTKKYHDLQQYVISRVPDESEMSMGDETNSYDHLNNNNNITNNETSTPINDETNSNDILSTVNIKTEADDYVLENEFVNQD